MLRRVAVLILALAYVPAAAGAVAVAERQALLELYDSTGGEEWIDRAGWLGASGTECTWHGVTCDQDGTTVVALELRENNLDGLLPDEIELLDGLVELDLSRNRLSGTVPSSIGALGELERLILRDNELVLPLPPAIFALSDLEELDLSGNLFNGPLPAELGALAALERIDLSHNAFRGAVPSTIANLSALLGGHSDFRYNALSADSEVGGFLDTKQTGGNWAATQTVPPTDLAFSPSLGLSWTQIDYTEDRGTYRISISQYDDLLETVATPSKSSNAFAYGAITVDGDLTAAVRTITEPHGRQKNLIASDAAEVFFKIQGGFSNPIPVLALGARPDPLVQIGGVTQNATFFTVVNVGESGAFASLLKTGDFFNISESFFFLGIQSTRRIDVTSVTQPVGEYFGGVEVTGGRDPLNVPIRLISLPAPADPEGVPQKRRLDLVSGRALITSSAVFRNDGPEVLSGVVESDVPWLIPITEALTIEPGETTEIEFAIDPAKRPDVVDEEVGVSFGGSLRLVYPDEVTIAGKSPLEPAEETTGVSTTLTKVVSTVPPPITSGTVPGFADGEYGFLVPGVRSGSTGSADLVTDLVIANSSGSFPVSGLNAYFATLGERVTGLKAALSPINHRSAVLLGALTDTIFDRPATIGSFQVRSPDSDSILASARLLAIQDEVGVFGSPLPVFDSRTTVEPGETIHLVGLGGGLDTGDLHVQAASGSGAQVSVILLTAAGDEVSTLGPIALGAWESTRVEDFVSSGVVTAVVQNEADSAGPIVAYAAGLDRSSNDPWVVVDWSAYWGEPRSIPVVVPLARAEGSPPASGRRRAVSRLDAKPAQGTGLDLALFNGADQTAFGMISFQDLEGAATERMIRLEARETVVLTNVLTSFFGRRSPLAGYLRVVPLRGEIDVSARLITTQPGGRVGSAVPVYPRGVGLTLGESRSIAGIEDSRQNTIEQKIGATWMTEMSLLETAGSPAVVRASARVPTGGNLAWSTVSRDFAVGANQLLQLGRIIEAIIGDGREGLDDLHDLQIEFRVIEGDGSVVVVTETIENATGDSIVRFD